MTSERNDMEQRVRGESETRNERQLGDWTEGWESGTLLHRRVAAASSLGLVGMGLFCSMLCSDVECISTRPLNA